MFIESLTVEQAQFLILQQRPEAYPERIQLSQAAGRVLYHPINAPYNLPLFDNSAMDGYAVQWRDLAELPARLPIVATIAAGSQPPHALEAGRAMRIMTGAPLPEGADTVVEQERCTVEGKDVIIHSTPRSLKGSNIRREGSYLAEGKPVVSSNQKLSAPHIGLLASLQCSTLEVYKRPTVAIISTGNELIEIDGQLQPGQIINSNSYMLEAMVRQLGAEPWVLPTARDNPKAIERTFTDAISSADIIISTGGVSVGEYDYVRETMNALTDGMEFWKVRIKPGKPLAFGCAKKTILGSEYKIPIIGLPGNPASSFVGFFLFVRPLVCALLGMPVEQAIPQLIQMPAANTVKGARGRARYVAGNLVRINELLHFEALPDQSSGNVALFCNARALAIVDEGVTEINKGEPINVHILP